MTRPDQRVWAPARRFNDERLNEPPTGKEADAAAATLANPWLMNSRSADHRWPSSSANTREIDAASANPTKAMTTPATATEPNSPQGRSSPKSGRPVGMSPTRGPSNPVASVQITPPIMAMRAPGSSRWRRRPNNTSRAVAAAITSAWIPQRPGWPTAQQARHSTLPSGGTVPKALGSCEAMINRAAPEVKPVTTGSVMR